MVQNLKSMAIPLRKNSLAKTNKCFNIFRSYIEFKYLKNVKRLSDIEIGRWIKNKLI